MILGGVLQGGPRYELLAPVSSCRVEDAPIPAVCLKEAFVCFKNGIGAPSIVCVRIHYDLVELFPRFVLRSPVVPVSWRSLIGGHAASRFRGLATGKEAAGCASSAFRPVGLSALRIL